MIDPYIARLCSLEGRMGVITGGSQGIGVGIVKILALAAAKIHSFSRSGQTKESFTHQNVVYHSVDIVDRSSVAQKLDDLCANGRLDFLINNAGITHKETAQDVAQERWQQIHDINLQAAFSLCQESYSYLKKSVYVGRIIHITSMAAHLGFSDVVPYCASKAGLLGLSRGLAVEWAKENILVNSISPGWIHTKMTEKIKDPARIAKILERMALHKFGNAEDIGSAALFLLSDMGKYITGADIVVDGGALCYGY